MSTPRPPPPLPAGDNLKVDIVTQITTLFIASMAFVSALAWNDLIKTFIEKYLKRLLPQVSELLSLLIYAIIVTVLGVFVTVALTKLKDDLLNTPSVQLQK